MTHKVIFDPVALGHLENLYNYIAEHSYTSHAKSFTDSIIEYCESFATLPHRGTRIPHLRPNLRTIGFRRRVTIAFTVTADTVTILGIYYRGQNVKALLAGRQDL